MSESVTYKSSTITVRGLWITRKSVDGGFHIPELLLAWDDVSIDENWNGWDKACREAMAACGDDVAQWRIIELAVPVVALEAAFAVPRISLL